MASLYAERVGAEICSPFVDAAGVLHVVSQATGDVLAISGEGATSVLNTGGQPAAVAPSPRTGALYVADLAHSAVLSVDADEGGSGAYGKPSVVVRVYEDKAFKGPSALCFDSKEPDSLYFTDSGALGETGLHAPRGSLYYIAHAPGGGGQMLRPLALECLAHPCALAVSPDGARVYVAEMMTNRVLCYVQRPAGVFHGSVFAQLGGSIGPSCLACDAAGNVYVGLYGLASAGAGAAGRVAIFGPDGRALGEIAVPAPEITGLCLSGTGQLFITEASTGSVYAASV